MRSRICAARRRFFHECQQRKLGRRAWHALLKLSDTRLLDHIFLRHERQFLAVFRFPSRLPIELVDRCHERIDDQQKDERGCDHSSACGHDDALALREMLPPFFQHLHHGRCTA